MDIISERSVRTLLNRQKDKNAVLARRTGVPVITAKSAICGIADIIDLIPAIGGKVNLATVPYDTVSGLKLIGWDTTGDGTADKSPTDVIDVTADMTINAVYACPVKVTDGTIAYPTQYAGQSEIEIAPNSLMYAQMGNINDKYNYYWKINGRTISIQNKTAIFSYFPVELNLDVGFLPVVGGTGGSNPVSNQSASFVRSVPAVNIGHTYRNMLWNGNDLCIIEVYRDSVGFTPVSTGLLTSFSAKDKDGLVIGGAGVYNNKYAAQSPIGANPFSIQVSKNSGINLPIYARPYTEYQESGSSETKVWYGDIVTVNPVEF